MLNSWVKIVSMNLRKNKQQQYWLVKKLSRAFKHKRRKRKSKGILQLSKIIKELNKKIRKQYLKKSMEKFCWGISCKNNWNNTFQSISLVLTFTHKNFSIIAAKNTKPTFSKTKMIPQANPFSMHLPLKLFTSLSKLPLIFSSQYENNWPKKLFSRKSIVSLTCSSISCQPSKSLN